MKLLFDENLAPRLVADLSDLFPDSAHVYSLELDNVPDQDIYEAARTHGYVVVTRDSDFCDLCELRGFPPKVIWIRIGNCSTREIERLLREHHPIIVAFQGDLSLAVLGLL
jgi:predicted nuclease of predicted toxin-antitoxin system